MAKENSWLKKDIKKWRTKYFQTTYFNLPNPLDAYAQTHVVDLSFNKGRVMFPYKPYDS